MQQHDEEIVHERHACPACGERRLDMLCAELNDNVVECFTCGTRYDPVASSPARQVRREEQL